MVSIHYGRKHLCGGSIITRRSVLTAGHCMNSFFPSLMTVRCGSSSNQVGGKKLQVSSYLVHPLFNQSELAYDIGIIYMAEPFEFSRTVKPIRITTREYDIDTLGVIAGWGSTQEGGTSINEIRFVNVRMLEYYECTKKYKMFNRDIQLCVGHLKGGKDSCQGDSGGPLVIQSHVVGIVSYGLGCARAKTPGVYTNVYRFSSWIADNMYQEPTNSIHL